MQSVDFVLLAIVLVSILISMTLHEAMHAYASHWLGDTTAKDLGRLTLNPLAHIDLFTTILLPLMLVVVGAPPFGAAKPVPFNPDRLKYGEYGAALVGLAGPLTNLLLALVAGLSIRLAGPVLDGLGLQVLGIFTLVNLSFFIFNMIPFPPLDGSRVVYSIAPDFVRNIMERIESMGFIALIIFLFIFYYVLSGPFTALLAWSIQAITGGAIFI